MSYQLIDIGVNLGHRSFRRDREEVIQRAIDVGVTKMIVTGTSLRESIEASVLAKRYPDILYSTAGVHPHDAQHCDDETIEQLRKLASDDEVVAIGECGLDFNRDFSPRPLQEKWFARQIELACELQMPLFLHERDANERFLAILQQYKDALPSVVVHCFTGSEKALDSYLSEGFFIGITGWICDERRGRELQRIVKKIPLDRLMIETDSPFLTPRDMRPKPKKGRNEPAFLPHILESIAKYIQKTPSEVAQMTISNTLKFFAL